MGSSDASAFDGLAPEYDAEFTASALGQELRARVWQRMAALFTGRRRILELGCGTGEDAVWLARAGHRVVGIDASDEMIRVARRKAIAAGCADLVEFHRLPMESLDELPRGARFDAVFSNFGAINCVADLAGLSRTLAANVEPGSPLMFVVMGRHVPWEWAWYLARGDARRAFRRTARSGVAWRGLTIHYPTPRTLARTLAPHFTTRRTTALGFALPPSYAAAWLADSPAVFDFLKTIESAASRFTAGLADHFILEAGRA
jgi:SAM-dependent methyltransferase